MDRKELERHIKAAVEEIKGELEFSPQQRIVSDLGFESIDIIDLFFEIQRRTAIEVDLNEIAAQIGGVEGRRFNDMTAEDIIQYLQRKQNA